MSELAWLHGKPLSKGTIKASPDDFIVLEDLGFEPDGEGEHLLVRIRKTGCNTQFVAEQLARFAKIPARSVSYAGLKDRHAVTEQWFCLHLPGKESPDLSLFQLEGCEVVASARQKRKLRIGYLKGNAFQLVLRDISDKADVEQRLALIAQQGVPNYFGEQRFGRNGNNLVQARLWANNEIRVKERNKRSFYLSATRSALFNQITSARIDRQAMRTVWDGDALQLTGRGSWFVAKPDEDIGLLQQRLDNNELQITAPLPGDGELGSQSTALEFETQILAEQDELLGLLKRERVDCARRSILVQPQAMEWQWQDDTTLNVSFWLPSGCFATSVIRELLSLDSQDESIDE